MKPTIAFKKIHPDASLPQYAHEDDVGMDIKSIEDVTLLRGKPTLVHTGLKLANMSADYEIQVRPRSGLATKGVTVWNSPGTVDPNYRGEICVILLYMNEPMEHVYNIHKGDKIAQLVVAPVTKAYTLFTDIVEETSRGSDGFGSTGV